MDIDASTQELTFERAGCADRVIASINAGRFLCSKNNLDFNEAKTRNYGHRQLS